MNMAAEASLKKRPQPAGAASSFDRKRIAADLAGIAQSGVGGADLRREAVALLREHLGAARQAARSLFETNNHGLACAGHLSQIEDDLIRAVYDYVVAHEHPRPRRGGEAREDSLVVAAVGGYGRATLGPFSDIDLLFLVSERTDDATLGEEPRWSEKVAQAILYVLWDLHQKVGHATRSVEECLEAAQADMTVRTALTEARTILGDRKLFETLQRRFDAEIVQNTAADFVAAKLAERDTRLARAGRSRYLVEPNVKEGKGGLRDLNTLFWIAKYVYRVRDVADLVDAGLFSRAELHLFRRCESFLWRVRCHLHYVTGRAEERVSFDLQPILAARLGYVSRGGLAAVERFMKHYFLVAKEVGDLTIIVCAAMEERQAKPRALLDRFVESPRWRREFVTPPGFTIENDRVTIVDCGVFERDPVNIIRLFWVADQNCLAIHPDATRLVTHSLKKVDAALRANPEANRLFLEILTSRNAPEIILRRMNETGVLGRFIPEFGRIVALMQFNMYHHYTVDEHLLRAIGHLADLENHRRYDEHPLASEILPTIINRTVLVLALFLHDIAKGRTEDHSLAGINVARRLCPRLGLSPGETETVAWLIENHLVMSDTAQRRDLADRRTIETFAARVKTLERLKMLLILTICDIRAVGPGVWNGWKGELLRTLYWETEAELSGGSSAALRKSRATKARDELRQALKSWSDLDFEAYAQRHRENYWLRVDLAHKIRHAKLLNMSEVEMPAPIVDVETTAFRGVTELTVIAPDHPRLLAIIAGACAAAGANIVDAQVFTTTDGLALDMIFVSRAFDFDEDEHRRAERIALAIERALRGDIRLGDMVAAREALPQAGNAAPFIVSPEAAVDNSLSKRFTVIEVAGRDRIGLLYDLTTIISKLELNIGSAHIATFGEKAVDVFYVTDLDGSKITTPRRKARIQREIMAVFPPPAAAAVPLGA